MDDEPSPPYIEQQVFALLMYMNDRHDYPDPYQVYVDSEKALKALGKAAIPALIKNLKAEDDETRYIAADVLGNVGDENVVEPLIDFMLYELKPNISAKRGMAAAISLGKLGDQRAIKPLIEAVKRYQGPGWGEFFHALAKFGVPAKRAVIEIALQEDDIDLQKAAVLIAGWYIVSGGCDNDPQMLTIVAQKYPYTDTRVRAIEKLAALGHGQSKSVLLIIATRDKDSKVVEASNKALIKLEQDEQK